MASAGPHDAPASDNAPGTGVSDEQEQNTVQSAQEEAAEKGRVWPALLVGLIGCVIIWVSTPFNDVLLNLPYVSDSYLPASAIFLTLLLVLGINPLLRWLAPRRAFARGQLALILGMYLVACAVPGQGLMRQLPYSLARTSVDAQSHPDMAKAFAEMGMDRMGRQHLFPDPVTPTDEQPWASEKFRNRLIRQERPMVMWSVYDRLAEGDQGVAVSAVEQHAQENPDIETILSFMVQRDVDQSGRITMDEMPQRPDELPWSAWYGPALLWSLLMIGFWLMAVGLSVLVMHQWVRNERLSFPLLAIEKTLIEEPEPGQVWPSLFRSKTFWAGVAIAFGLHLLSGLNKYFPDGVPAIPLRYDLHTYFADDPLRHLPWWITHQIYFFFVFVGAAFFIPTRISFSIWATALIYALYEMVGKAYMPPFYPTETFADHRFGAMLAVTAYLLYIERQHWLRVVGTVGHAVGRLTGRRDDPMDDNDVRHFGALMMFVSGCALLFGWMVWFGTHWMWALVLVAFLCMMTLLIARIVAETGMPFVRIDIGANMAMMRSLPLPVVSPATLWMAQVVHSFTAASRVSAAPLATHGLALKEGASARRQLGIAGLFLGVLVLGFFVSGATHLWMGYHHSASLDSKVSPLSAAGEKVFKQGSEDVQQHLRIRRQQESARQSGTEVPDTRLDRPPHRRYFHLVVGIALAGLLQFLCLRSPRWPLHPIGLLMVDTWYAKAAWFSMMIGWMLKAMLVRFGGARLYRMARPLFIGLIMGEVAAAIVWAVVPALLVWQGIPYVRVDVLPM